MHILSHTTPTSAPILALAAVLTLTGCASAGGPTAGPVDVTRFHLAGPSGQLERGPIGIETPANSPLDAQSLEFQSYARAVSAELARNGYTPVSPGATSAFVARVNYRRGAKIGPPESRSPVSVGVGGSVGGYGSGVGVGIGFSPGRSRGSDAVFTELNVSIERRSDASVIWEGRADTQARFDAGPGAGEVIANKLAAALFRGFPGESGRTITVP